MDFFNNVVMHMVVIVLKLIYKLCKLCKRIIYANPMSYLCFDFVIPACPESFWKKDPGQARMTDKKKDYRRYP